MEEHNNLIVKEFKKQAKDFSNQTLSMNNQDYIKWMIRSLQLNKQMKVLDVAAGTGILSRAIAPYVDRVVSVDISEAMIEEGITQNDLQGINNIEYIHGHVEQLPFEEDTFDLVISRFAFHHFLNPLLVLTEMTRVCKSQADVAVIDMISDEDETLSEQYNYYERLRDPSHTLALTKTQFMDYFNQAGLEIQTEDVLQVPVNVNSWLTLTKTEDKIAQHIKTSLQQELISSNEMTGMFPFVQGDELMFKQTWLQIIGKKRAM
ncbi:class I SAM-dependent methyltransferase [Paenibacillus lutimineralis]|uniref:Methyltransferase domain-containing protein n=1 Tax=Paenibacillus lutimineralis TaxID=2707005 RepID=A0A3Q9I960_9BACL|nr:methyltransferase domain-containing protein [Paenibacillus lutimineralis]AZS15431.1 methyltransferase domain-containing protein [Paenibacillus lutimineralis]